MRRLILKMSMTVDGFVAGPNGEIDWMFPSRSADGTQWIADLLSQVGVQVIGSRTYAAWTSSWSSSSHPLAAPMSELPKLVFSRGGGGDDASRARPEPEKGWGPPALLTGDLTEEIQRLKAQPGKDILAHGGVSFAQNLVERALVDEYRLVVHPVVLGRGLPLFASARAPIPLHHVSTTVFTGGAVAHVYRPA